MLAIFGFCMAMAYHPPLWVWLAGFICILLDERNYRLENMSMIGMTAGVCPTLLVRP